MPEPKYEQVANTLRAEILAGSYPAGSVLATEPELGERFGVSRVTVASALKILRAEGLVHVEQGRGVFVRDLAPIVRDAVQRIKDRAVGTARGAFDAELTRLGLDPHTETTVGEKPAPADVAEALGIEPGQPVLTRARRMYAGEIPVQLATSWLPLDITAGTAIEQVDTGPGGTYNRLAELGHEVTQFTETIVLRPPTEAEQAFLRMDSEQRIYELRRTASDADGRTVEICDTFMPAHQWVLRYTW
jgi:GntR family transcriptional regulator